MKKGGTCCLADFGLAVRQDLAHHSRVEKVPSSPLQGTLRYMAPETIECTYDVGSFEAYRAADVYSIGLVMWEVLMRTETEGKLVTAFMKMINAAVSA